ncbi:MAG: ATP-binding cassette domain-containing protein, partial [Pseudomonadota bacterium]|nr:ATP-binding cassette domain-containing protein [Pseudomonadota bacterium]
MTLTAEALTLGYGDRMVVEHLDLTLPPGRVTAILGPNGCGKSTLLHALARGGPPLNGRGGRVGGGPGGQEPPPRAPGG